MAEQSLVALKVRSYLEGLSPRALAMLVRGLEAGREGGNEDPQSEIILETARSLIRKPETDRVPDAFRRSLLKRGFFHPLEPFLVTQAPGPRFTGRVLRASLDAVWLWMEREVASDKIVELQERLAAEDFEAPAVAAAAEELREAMLPVMAATLEDARRDSLTRQKLAFRLGGDEIFSELADMHAILSNAEAIEALKDELPDTLDAVDLKSDDVLLTQARAFVGKDELRGAWLASLLLERAEKPAWLAGFASRAAKAGSAKLTARSPYKPLVDILLAELHRHAAVASEMRGNPAQGALMVDSIRRFAELVRDINIEITVDDVGEWRTRLSGAKSAMSKFLNGLFDTLTADLRRVLKVPEVADDGRFRQDATAVQDMARMLRILAIGRHSGDELAVSEPARKLHHTVEQALDMCTRTLFDNLLKTKGDHRRACQATLNTAIGFCSIIFGDEYARTLRDRRDRLADEIDLASYDEDGLFADTPEGMRAS